MEIVFKIQKIEFDHAKSIAKLYGRDIKGRKICLFEKIYDYFLMDITLFSAEELELIKKELELRTEIFDAEINDTPAKFLKCFTKSIIETKNEIEKLKAKVFQINGERKENKLSLDFYEDDLNYEKKFLIEKNINYSTCYIADVKETESDMNVDFTGDIQNMKEVPTGSVDIKPKILYFDLETYDDGKGIDFTKNPILMVSLYSDNPQTLQKVLVAKEYATKRDDIEMCGSEQDMLDRLVNFINIFKPDIISGYNIKNFDLPYILERCNVNKVKCHIGADFSEVEIKKNKSKFNIEGIQIFDMYEFLKRIMRGSVPDDNMKLDTVCKSILGRQKEEVKLKELSLVWEDHKRHDEIDKFVSYCLTDSILVFELYNYFSFDIIEFSKMLNVSFDELAELSFSQIVEIYLINNCRENNQIVPRLPNHDEISARSEKRLQGAFVFKPQAGYYEKLVVFDFRSLYPSLIESHNIAKGRLFLKKEFAEKKEHEKHLGKSHHIEKLNSIEEVPERPYYILQEPKAFIPNVVGKIIERRGRLKELIKTTKDEKEKALLKSRIGTLKLIANSLYGYLGFNMARWYSFECAESVTAFGRYYIKKTIDIFNNKNFTVVYSDTDSIFVLLGDGTVDTAMKVLEEINDSLPGLMTLEFESEYKCGIFVETKVEGGGAKKRYALLDTLGKLKIVGMTVVRGDSAPVARDIQKKVLEILLKEKDVDKAKKLVKLEIKNLNKREVKDFVLKTRLTKPVEEYESNSPHVIIAKKMIEMGKPVFPGNFVEYIISNMNSNNKGNKPEKGTIGERAKMPDEVTIKNIDFDYYIHNQILAALESIFDVFDVNISEFDKDQSDLTSFF